jgi:23S rRNA pseudouridine1911/1915/1917 synthase
MQKEFERVVSEKMWGKRLDHYLLLSGIGISRNRVHRLIKTGGVLVNDKISKPGYTVKPSDHIKAQFELEHDLKITGEPMELDIVYEDNEVLVVNKPAGVVVHPAKGHGHGTLVQGLLHHCRNLPEHPDSKIRPGVIHRLDKDTTGLLLFAKTDDALSSLGRAIETRKITREYLALAWGIFPQDKGMIEAPIGRNILDRKKMAVTPFSAKTAATGFEVIEHFEIATYLKLRLLTGRTHQIRVHLTHYGHPVVGDPEYGGRSKTIINKKSEMVIFKKILSIINRQALHAHMLGFHHPRTGKYIQFTSPLPQDFSSVLKYLRSLSI